MMDYLQSHRLEGVIAVALLCLLVGYIEFRLLRDKKIAAATWAFGLVVLSVFIGSPGGARIVWAFLLLIGGAAAILMFLRERRW